MLSIIASVIGTATRTGWNPPNHWKMDEPRQSSLQLRRQEEEWRRRAMRDVGRL